MSVKHVRMLLRCQEIMTPVVPQIFDVAEECRR